MLKTLAMLAVTLVVALAASGQQKKTSDPQRISTVATQHDWLDYLSGASAVALAVIGYFGVRYAKRTLDNIERQANTMEKQAADARAAFVQSTEIAQKAADAALMQANYLVTAERPFLMIEASGFEVVEFKVVNRGKTPAQIIFYSNVPKMNTPLLTEEWNPSPYYGKHYDGMELVNPVWLAPNDPPLVVGAYYLSALKEGDPGRWEEVRTLKRLMYVWSAVKYRGIFGQQCYESRYCYRVTSDGPKMEGPPGLNAYT